MRSAFNRPRAGKVPATVAAVFLISAAGAFFSSPAPPARAADPAAPQPAKKDSSPRIRPAEVILTPSVSPAEAKAGEKVSYRVTAKIAPGWHIYAYSKTPIAGGPRSTSFDFFDTGRLKLVGDWTASDPPIRHKEPAFPNLPFLEYHENEVTWSVTLLVPPGTEPGKKTLRSQASYQICDAVSCKIPGQWTLPDVTLDVLPGG